MKHEDFSAPAIEAEGLTRYFGKVKAVCNINLMVNAGEVFCILGPNGAGKTTTIRMLATLLSPTSGTARIFGHDIMGERSTIRHLVSLTGQFASVDEDLTGWENLMLLSQLLGYSYKQARERSRELLEGFALDEAAHRQVKKYSGGMRKRLDIAASIVVRPRLIFLDEPTTGLDPRSRNQVWEVVRAMVAQGTTVLLTTQYLEEADQLADRIALIDHGRVIARGTPSQLKTSLGKSMLRIQLEDRMTANQARIILQEDLQAEVEMDASGQHLRVVIKDASQASTEVHRLAQKGVGMVGFSLGQPSLDEVFLALTGSAEPGPDQQDDPCNDQEEIPSGTKRFSG